MKCVTVLEIVLFPQKTTRQTKLLEKTKYELELGGFLDLFVTIFEN